MTRRHAGATPVPAYDAGDEAIRYFFLKRRWLEWVLGPHWPALHARTLVLTAHQRAHLQTFMFGYHCAGRLVFWSAAEREAWEARCRDVHERIFTREGGGNFPPGAGTGDAMSDRMG